METAGRVLMGTVGGASGALYGRGFQRAGASLAALDGAGASGPAATREIRASAALAAAVDAIGALGRAAPGEKTMLDDSSRPATRARRPSGRVPRSPLPCPVRRRPPGPARTRRCPSWLPCPCDYLGERSIGHLDPGAASAAILLRALADAAAAG